MVSLLEFHPQLGFDSKLLANTTLLLPSCNSIGNIGQLSLDLLISSLNAQLVGHLESPFVLPVVGSNAFSDKGIHPLTTSFEVFQSPQTPTITLLQIRGTIIPNRSQLFASSIHAWAESIQVARVIIVSGADATARIDSQISRPVITFYTPLSNTSTINSVYGKEMDVMQWTKLEELTETNSGGVGLVKFLVKTFEKQDAGGIPLLCLLWYTVEGDNIPDSQYVVSGLNQLLKLSISDYKMPPSWKGLFGNAPPSSSIFL
ncbi:hypothetical protein SmJEL517_g00190 [Synchytrium microbalum]|uniref:Proteasome assembly chaperone 2 n=1 Tax=Synchytrium microbalum TaxID=1806994 RepID=A0A507CKK5_9FUNG|nr:uncharacterized protein SmJEL517_g00190 [Synchytrium microbalum]TPX38373.1 hypothetical protein SmJEL517_g00190 [Synchytrium microbalum]